MKSINDLICKPDEAIDIVNRSLYARIQQAYSTAKRGAIPLGGYLTAGLADFMKNTKHGQTLFQNKYNNLGLEKVHIKQNDDLF
jgi:hypothetical protein